ncbi:Imm1 family immunity protein [Saccharothrix sp. HUAS TT1]|uniref:Imm1 family immunity protein n=1 Tax=unclassified Saccharothrix TaxID=2593673 RepID=UPI00345BEB31
MVALIAAYDPEGEGPEVITTAAELDTVLDRVAEWGHRALVELRPADPADGLTHRYSLSVGLHGDADQGTLIYSSSDGMWFSKATPGPEWVEAERILYYFMSSDTEYPPDSEIPAGVVRRAAHEFMTAGGQLPTGPDWHTPPPWYPTPFR